MTERPPRKSVSQMYGGDCGRCSDTLGARNDQRVENTDGVFGHASGICIVAVCGTFIALVPTLA